MPLDFRLDHNDFTLSDECLDAMARVLKKTRVKERGFMLCAESPSAPIYPSSDRIGGANSIKVRDCRGQGRGIVVGAYHTHPDSTCAPSWYDAFALIRRAFGCQRPTLGCRAGTKDKTVRCEAVKETPTLVEVNYFLSKRKGRAGTLATTDPEICAHLTEPIMFPISWKPEPKKTTRETVVDYDRNHSLEELRKMCRDKGVTVSGDKKTLARRLIAV